MGKSFLCQHCTKCFPTKRHLHEHEKRKHPAASSTTRPTTTAATTSSPKPTIEASKPVQNEYYPTNQSYGYYANQPVYNYVQTPPSNVAEEEDNLGSLLRLVYHCPDTQIESGYVCNQQPVFQQGYHHQHQSNFPAQKLPPNPDQLINDYAILEGLPLDCLQ